MWDKKALCFMLFVLLSLGLWASPSSVQAQAPSVQRYTLDVRGWTVKAALERLVDSTHVSLVYDVAMLEGKRTRCQAQGVLVEALLRCILAQTGLDVEPLSSGTFMLKKVTTSTPQPAVSPANTISGTVYDAESGDSLRDAAVYDTNHRVGTTTNAAGHYHLQVSADSTRLAVSHIGYEEARFALPLQGHVARDIGLNPVVLWMDSLRVVAEWDDEDQDSIRSRTLFHHVRGVHVGIQPFRGHAGDAVFVFGYRFNGKVDLGVAFNNTNFITLGVALGYATLLSKKGWGARLGAVYHYRMGIPDGYTIRRQGLSTDAQVYRKYRISKKIRTYPGVGVYLASAIGGDFSLDGGGVQFTLPFSKKLKSEKKRGFVFEPLFRYGYARYFGRTFTHRSFGIAMRFTL